MASRSSQLPDTTPSINDEDISVPKSNTRQEQRPPPIRSPSITTATEQVVKAAVNMERSDSVLFSEDEYDNDNESLTSESSTTQQQRRQEDGDEPSIETMLSSSERETKILHSPHRMSSIRRQSQSHHQRSSSSMNASSSGGGDVGETHLFLPVDSGNDGGGGCPDDESATVEPSIPPPHPLHKQQKEESTESSRVATPRSPVEILESCGAMPLSLPELRSLYRRRQRNDDAADVSNDEDIVTALLHARQQQATTTTRRQRQSPHECPSLLNAQDEAMVLHSIFVTFCYPPPSQESVARILEMETRFLEYDDTSDDDDDKNSRRVELPKDVLISVSGAPKVSVISLLTHEPDTHLLKLPLRFQLAFFRILIRILTNETDVQYNQECLFACDWIDDNEKEERRRDYGDDMPPPDDEVQPEIDARREALKKMRQSLLTDTYRKTTIRHNQVYSIVRFRSGTSWKEHVVSSLMRVFRALLLQEGSHQVILAPVSRLMGLCATAGIQVKELREMLALSGRPFSVSTEGTTRRLEPGLDRLLMIRALSTAAEGASRSSFLVGKASPRYFFSFGLGHGLARTFHSITNWPFRNDFGMAVWFRAENFEFRNARHYPKLFSARTHDGGGIEVTLVPLKRKSRSDTPATVIAVAVYDSQASGKEAAEVQQVKLSRCILLPQVWYHVAVRHTRSRLKGVFSMSSRQQVSIMLDGKTMLTESLKFPKIAPLSESGLRNTLVGRHPSGRPSGSSMTIQCGANFEGQAGSFYVFNDNVSDTTLRTLYEVTGGTNEVMKRKSFSTEDYSWDERRSSIAVRSHALSVEITQADAEEIVLSSHENEKDFRSDSNTSTAASAVADMVDDGQEASYQPIELSKSSFGSKLFLVWDPRRVEDQVAIELHSGAHVKVDADRVQTWHVEGAKDVISSVGGVQALIPVFRALLAGDVEAYWPKLDGKRIDGKDGERQSEREKVYIIIPSLLYMLGTFLRNHGENAREMLRCGGIDIVEQLLASNKALGTRTDGNQEKETLMSVLTVYPFLGSLLVSSLLDIRAACSHYTGLETIVYSRLLFNFRLWFSSQSESNGVVLFATLLPTLSFLSKKSPRKVRDCVGVRPMIQQLSEYTDVGETENLQTSTGEALTDLFDRSRWSGLRAREQLTPLERKHVIDILLAMTGTLLASGTLPGQLQSLLSYISYNVDVEWEQASHDIKCGSICRTGKRNERYLTNIKASTVLLCLLQARPEVSGLIESLSKCCGGELGTAGWLLCCMVNTYDDEMRSVGLRCLAAYLDRVAPRENSMLTMVSPSLPASATGSEHSAASNQNHILPFTPNGVLSSARFTNTISNVGKGLAAIGNTAALSQILPSSKVSVKVVYKLLWHLLKCHRERSEKTTHSALLQILLENGELMHSYVTSMNEFVVKDDTLHCGYTIKMDIVDTSSLSLESYSDEKLRRTPAISTILLLLRYFPSYWRRRWLCVLVEICEASQTNVDILLTSTQWQPPLFHLVSDIVEEMAASCSNPTISGDPDSGSDPSSSFDLCFKLYANILGHCFRHGGEQTLQILEQAASLQRTCVNGQEVMTLILNYLLADLAVAGTKDTPTVAVSEDFDQRNTLLKQGARAMSNVISNGNDGFDTASVVQEWRCLRHLTSIISAVITKIGFGVADLFDYRNQHASAVDELSGGLYGIRLSESTIPGMTAMEYANVLSQSSPTKRDQRDQRERDLYRQTCVIVSAQVLSLLDPFIFPSSLDETLAASQLHGFALVRSSEPRLGVSQGPVLSSLVRLSLVLMCHLEPSSVAFLQCVGRLRCFVQWMFDLIRESVSLAGYSKAFDEMTAPMDRLLLAIVLQTHRSLARCSAVVAELEASEYSVYFKSEAMQKKNLKRVLRAALELREIVLAVFRGRNEVIRASLSAEAFDALKSSLETTPMGSKDAVIRAFLNNTWVANFQDVSMHEDVAIPAQLVEDQKHSTGEAGQAGINAVEAIAAESNAIIADFNRTLDIHFGAYCEYQRQWAETDAVRDLEYEGDGVIQTLSNKHRSEVGEIAKQLMIRTDAAQNRFSLVERNVMELWKIGSHWKLAEHTDMLNRRMLLDRNREFLGHQDASYELMLNMEREKAARDREERERKKQEEELAELIRRNPSAYVPYDPKRDADDETFDDTDHEMLQNDSPKDETNNVSPLSSDPNAHHEDENVSNEESKMDAIDGNGGHFDADDTRRDLVGSSDTDAWAKMFIWSSSESVVARFEEVSIVSLQTITEGRLLLTTHGLYFNQTGTVLSVMTKQPMDKKEASGPSSRRWRLSRLTEVHGRRFMLRAQALELFFSDCYELFVNFVGGTRERDKFYAKLRNSCKVPLLWSPKSLNPRTVFKRSQLTQLWRKRRISNFQYLMQLNKMAGRTFNDITQYPVFPWVLSDYTSKELDLNDSTIYRDLSKPVGALNPDRLSQLIERYKELESFGFAENERFLYGSHYSSPGVVLHYMLRQEPFTSMAIELQSGRFDCPDRLFFDIAGCWASCLTSTSDVKELIPEFFTCPEMFLNTNHFPLGRTQADRPVENVGLPPWAKGSAYEFVRMHRLALESDFVSQNLHKWIDLIFGYKQRGAEAETAHNVFHYLSYEGAVDLDQITDEIDRTAAESHIQNFGQTPCQLITKEPHPTRLPASSTWLPLISDISVPRYLRCHKPLHQFGGKHGGVARGAVVCIHVMSESVLVMYADMSICTYKWEPKRRGKHPFSFKRDKHRYLSSSEISSSLASIKRSSALPQSMGGKGSRCMLGSWSVAVTLGGQTRENLRRKELIAPSRLVPSSDTINTAEALSMIVSCGYWDDTVKVHSIDGSRLLCSTAGGHRGPIRCIAIGACGGLMVSGGDDGTCRVWVVDHPDMAIALSDGYVQTALGASNDKEQLLSCCHVLWGHETAVTCVALSSDLDIVVSGSLGGTICVHTVRRGHFVRSFSLATALRSIVLGTCGTFVAHTEEGFLYAYTINGVLLRNVDANELLNDMKMTCQGEILVTGGEKGHVVVRAVHDLGILSMLDLSRHGPVRCISFTPEELNPIPQFLFVGSDDGLITIVDRDPHAKSEVFDSEYVSFKL